MKKISVILAGNREIWWEGLLGLLKERSPEYEVAAVCYDALETIEKANQFKPDILLLDEEIKGGDCGEIAQRINRLHIETNIIILIKPYKNIDLSSLLKANVKGYVDKDISYSGLASTILHVYRGDFAMLSQAIARLLMKQVETYRDTMFTHGERNIGLSKREREVLTMLANKGTTNKEMAAALHITNNTVKAHLSSIMEKMQVRNRQQATIIAREIGIVPDSELTK
jgi:DNA-binding NarL/FixJ family response regulator